MKQKSSNQKLEYYSPIKLLSYNALVYMITSARGHGKTFNVLEHVINNCKRNKTKFVYLRRTDKELMRVKGKIFNALELHGKIKPREFYCVGDTFYTNKKNPISNEMEPEVFGYCFPLNLMEQYKSTAYDDVEYIIFEEFVREDNRYLPREMELFLSSLETIIRLRDNVKVIMLSNLMSKYNPYFVEFGVVPKARERFVYNKERGVVLEQYHSISVSKKKETSKFGKLIAGTEYGDFISENKNIKDNTDFILTLNKKRKYPCYNFMFGGKEYCFYRFESNDIIKYYIDTGFNPQIKRFFNLDNNLKEFATNKVRGSSKFLQFLYDRGREGKMYFSTGEVKAEIESLFFSIR